MKSEELNKAILKASEGILSTVTDFLLWELVYLGEATTTFSRNTWESRIKADRFLEKINYETIKRAIQRGREKGWIKKAGKKRVWPEVTNTGKKRLASLIPLCDKERTWDKRLYLVTYDIPEARKRDRELLREHLKRIGAGMIQESVWLTPYNPNDILREFIKERNLEGTVIVSDIGEDGNIGQENIQDLLIRVYHLDEINQLYQQFLDTFEGSKAESWEVAFNFLSILKKDPQLPYELLSSDWVGKRAYHLFLKFNPKLST